MFEVIGFGVIVLIGVAALVWGSMAAWFLLAFQSRSLSEWLFPITLLAIGASCLYYSYMNSPFVVVQIP